MFHLSNFSRKRYGRTDGLTDDPTDGPTDIPSYRDARTHLEMRVASTNLGQITT